MNKPQTTKIILFISKLSIYFQSTMAVFKEVVEELEDHQPFEVRVIDVEEEPEVAEEYKVDAIPLLIIGDKRFVGNPDKKKILSIVKEQ
jgi:thioredoxin-like negative regulator of GroEL